MKRLSRDMQSGQLFVRDLDAGRIDIAVFDRCDP